MGVLFSKASCKPFLLINTYVFLAQAVGCTFVLSWAIELLTAAKSSIDPAVGNVLLGLTGVVMTAVTGALLYKVGKRPMALISAAGMMLVCFVLGWFIITNDKPSLVPTICLILYMAFGSLGFAILPNLMAFELYPLQVRGILGGATSSFYCLTIFASTKMEPFVMNVLGLGYTFVAFGCFSLLGIIFLYSYLPETKDLTLQEIEEYYKEYRPTLVSQRRLVSMSQMGILSCASMSKSKAFNKSIMGISEQTKPSAIAIAKLEAQKRLSEVDSNTSVIYEEDDLGRKSVDGKKIRRTFEETANEDYIQLYKKDKKSKKQKNKDGDNETPKKLGNETPKDEDNETPKKLGNETPKDEDNETPKKLGNETPKDEDNETPKNENQPSTSKKNT